MAIYKRLSNPKMDEAMRASRERFGLKMVPTREAKAWVAEHVADPIAVVMGFDQSPADPAKSWWTSFLNQETAWYYGLEQFARQHDMPVIFGHIRKLKRGWYETEYELVADNPRELPEGDILRRCIDLLEKDIEAAPTEWLWSHKRWKHKRPADQPLNAR
jgi:KDO2-lipid IV(A) lauroyltransferase